jgi:hypothetical protein
MLTSITPLGERGRANRWALTTTAYVLTSALAGTAVGAALGGLGGLLHPSATAALIVLALAAALAALLDASGRRPPSWSRQVDENWLRSYRGWVYGAGFGGQLGVGVVTIVTSATVYAVLLAEAGSGRPAVGAVLGLAFGAGRALPLLTTRTVTSPGALAAYHRRIARSAAAARWATVALALAVAGGALAVAAA